MKQVNLDKMNENFDEPTHDIDGFDVRLRSEDKDEYRKVLDRLRNDPNDMEIKFRNEYPKVTDDELEGKNLLKTEKIEAEIVHAYCPQCGRELVCEHNAYVMPSTGVVIAKHECACGYKANLDHAYPFIIFTDSNNNKYEISLNKKI